MSDREFEGAIYAAASADYDARRSAERKLASEAPAHFGILRRLLDHPDVGVRRTVVEILRRVAPKHEEAYCMLRDRLSCESDIKTRRRIIAALGESGRVEARELLLEHLEKEEHRFVQASLILALGELGYRDWPVRWAALRTSGGPVGEALRKAMQRVPSEPPSGVSAKCISRPEGTYLLSIYPGLEKCVDLELRRAELGPATLFVPGWLRVEAQTPPVIEALSRLTTVVSDFHSAADGPFATEDDLLSLLERGCQAIALTESGQGRPSFRLSIPRQSTRSRYRSLIERSCVRIEQNTGWQNNPSDYNIDLRVLTLGNKGILVWRDRLWLCARSGEQRETVPASIHPTVAAALCHLALHKLQGAAAGHLGRAPVLLDPCCGAGTILREWLRVVPDGQALGYDQAPDAIQKARRNLAGMESRAKVAVGRIGLLQLSEYSMDAVIANLPFGIRVGRGHDYRRLYHTFVQEAVRLLKPGGALVAYTADKRAIIDALSQAGFAGPRPWTVVNAGGLDVSIFAVESQSLREPESTAARRTGD